MIRFSFHTTRGAVIPRTLSSSEFAQKVVEYRWLVSDFATKQVWTHTGFASGGIPQWVIDASTANTLHVEASSLPEEAGEEKGAMEQGEEKGAMEQGSASEEKKKKKKKKKKKTRDIPKAGATVQVEATEETEKGTEEVAKELSKGENVEQHPTAGLTTEEVTEAEEELIEEVNEEEVTEAEEEEKEEHPTGGHTTEEVTKEVKAMEERTDDPPAEQINDEVPKENEDTQDTLWTVKLTNTDELNRNYTVIGGRQKNVSDFLLSLSTAMTKLSTAVAKVDKKVDEGFAKVEEIRRSQEKLEKSQEKLQKAVSDTAVMSQLQQWVIQKCGRQPELPVGIRLPYVASARLETLASSTT